MLARNDNLKSITIAQIRKVQSNLMVQIVKENACRISALVGITLNTLDTAEKQDNVYVLKVSVIYIIVCKPCTSDLDNIRHV